MKYLILVVSLIMVANTANARTYIRGSKGLKPFIPKPAPKPIVKPTPKLKLNPLH